MSEHVTDKAITPETCEVFLEKEDGDDCATCSEYNTCWGESPWTEAQRR